MCGATPSEYSKANIHITYQESSIINNQLWVLRRLVHDHINPCAWPCMNAVGINLLLRCTPYKEAYLSYKVEQLNSKHKLHVTCGSQGTLLNRYKYKIHIDTRFKRQFKFLLISVKSIAQRINKQGEILDYTIRHRIITCSFLFLDILLQDRLFGQLFTNAAKALGLDLTSRFE